MEFRVKRDHSYKEHLAKEGVTGIAVDARTLLDWKAPKPESGDTWGNWRYDSRLLVLTHVPHDYEIRLDECSTSAETLDWIFQVASKAWMTDKDTADLIHALHDILKPQVTLCSFGADKKLDVKKYLTAKV